MPTNRWRRQEKSSRGVAAHGISLLMKVGWQSPAYKIRYKIDSSCRAIHQHGFSLPTSYSMQLSIGRATSVTCCWLGYLLFCCMSFAQAVPFRLLETCLITPPNGPIKFEHLFLFLQERKLDLLIPFQGFLCLWSSIGRDLSLEVGVNLDQKYSREYTYGRPWKFGQDVWPSVKLL